jgi:hypothetical protein
LELFFAEQPEITSTLTIIRNRNFFIIFTSFLIRIDVNHRSNVAVKLDTAAQKNKSSPGGKSRAAFVMILQNAR